MKYQFADHTERLIKITEKFGFDVGMHNSCLAEALKKRVKKYANNAYQLEKSVLSLLGTRLEYLKERAKWWNVEQPGHHIAAEKWKEKITSETFNSAHLGTIIAIGVPDEVFSYNYYLKTSGGWITIVNIKTTDSIFNADSNEILVDIENDLLKFEKNISMVYSGFTTNPKHITDLKALSIGTNIKTPLGIFTKFAFTTWRRSTTDEVLEDKDFTKWLTAILIELA